MTSVGTVVSFPIPVYANVPIQADFYQPSRFVISAITEGLYTTVTTTEDHNYVVGQQVRILIPRLYGAQQLNGVAGMVIAIPSATMVTIDIDSTYANAFISNPLTSVITGASNTDPLILTTSNPFLIGNYVTISGVTGMTELNGNSYQILSGNTTTLTLNVDAATYGVYAGGGLATLVTTEFSVPQIIALGDNNSGQINSSGRSNLGTFIPGSFENISPL